MTASKGQAVPNLLTAPDRRLRNGWWILLFVLLFLASRVAYTPLVRALKDMGAPEAWLEPARFGFVLLVTWICVRLRRQRLDSVGFDLGRRWVREAGIGTLLGLGSALLAVALMAAAGGVQLALDPARSVAALAYGLYLFLFVSLFEETLFRGFVFQRLVDGMGAPFALVSLALLFSASHWGNPDMDGMAMAVASVELFLGALLLGLAWLRTRSLALPVGIHLGWNWAQGHLLGFDVSGFDQAGWFQPRLQEAPAWLTGGDFGLEASACAVVADLVLIALLWRWKRRPADVSLPGRPAPVTAGGIVPS